MTPALTAATRKRLVDALCADLVEGASRQALVLWDMAEQGFVGFSQRSDEELVKAAEEAFDEDAVNRLLDSAGAAPAPAED